MARHKHADVIIAWAEGKEIEVFHSNVGWINYAPFPNKQPEWDLNREYRIKPHKFQDVIDAYLRGETVQYYCSNGWNSGWMDCSRGRDLSSFDNGDEYRIKPHKFQDVIDAYLRGETVQYKWKAAWMDCGRGGSLSMFDNGDEYRIKPKPDIVKHCHVYLNIVDNIKISSTPFDIYNVQFTFDGVTQQLKSVELI
jgi:hypothetical protein